MTNTEKEIQQQLFKLQDLKYRDFSSKLTPTVDPKTIIGVRTPALRKLARAYAHTPAAAAFIKILPHRYFEENNLHGFLIETIAEYDIVIDLLESFFPYMDNWATCDLISPKVFQKNLLRLYARIKIWIQSERTYTARFGIGMLMRHFLGDNFQAEMLEIVASVRSEEYYLKMMVAWYFATALVKQPDAAMPFIEEVRLDKWTHNKAIQKAIESYRINEDTKAYLRTLKVK
ncbi:MAG: DNA alkylation repair protein [Clostridia bacterium]|nr:DNA alkylation repair protein [Clostridia bacterium]